MPPISSGEKAARSRFRMLIPIILLLAVQAIAPLPGFSAGQDEGLHALRETGKAFVRVSRKVTPAVVNIKTYQTGGARQLEMRERFFGEMFEPFKEFFGRDFNDRLFGRSDGKRRQLEAGSGVIVESDGIVLTNNHVIEGADQIMVTLADRREFAAEVVGSDPRTDIAVLRLPEGKYPYAELGNSDELEVGEWVVAIGNPFGLGQSVTVGVVSAKGRANVGIADLEDFIQTDAAINPGNSGGPLIDLDGAVIGINTAIFSRSGGYQGIGFAVPSNMAEVIMEGLLRTGRIVRSDLGIRVQEAGDSLLKALGASSVRGGVVVSELINDGAAYRAGIKRGDVIVRVRGREIADVDGFYRVVSVLPVDKDVPVVVIREGLPQTLMVRAGLLPSRPQSSPMRLRTALGFAVEELTEELAERLGYRYERGVVITRVTRMSQADRAGLEPGDLIIRVNGDPVPDLETFRKAFESVDWGREVGFDVMRKDRPFKVTLILSQGE